MSNIIIITTTKQAEEMLKRLDACCGRQWWNQDTGYGLGDCCVKVCNAAPTQGAYSDSYGVSGIHFLIPGAN